MKLVHVLMLLTFTITVVHSFVIRGIRDIGLHAIVPEIQIIKELYQQLQRHARQELSHMDIEPEMTMTTPQIIQHMGYPAETHHVTTEDGYILEIHRIPNHQQKTNRYHQLPIFITHGFLSSSSSFVMNLNQSLAFMLADAGYDVWMGNFRGNSYARRHTHLNPNSTEFWNFSYDEMAAYDTPVMIDYVLNATGQRQIHLIAYSMGATVSFAMLSTKLEYNNKIGTMVAFAPATSMKYFNNKILRVVSHHLEELSLIADFLYSKELLPSEDVRRFLSQYFCRSHNIVCQDFIEQIAGSSKHSNYTRAPIYMTQGFDNGSVKTLIHFGQLISGKKMQKFDGGYLSNILLYGSVIPPLYDLNKVTIPVAIFYGGNDALINAQDVKLTATTLKNIIGLYEVSPSWNHYDFVKAIDGGKLLNNKIIEIFNKAHISQK